MAGAAWTGMGGSCDQAFCSYALRNLSCLCFEVVLVAAEGFMFSKGPGLWMLAAQPFFVLGTAYLMEDAPAWGRVWFGAGWGSEPGPGWEAELSALCRRSGCLSAYSRGS